MAIDILKLVNVLISTLGDLAEEQLLVGMPHGKMATFFVSPGASRRFHQERGIAFGKVAQ